MSEPVARALFNEGVTLSASGHNEEAIAVYDQLITIFSTETETLLLEQVARALINKGGALSAMGRSREAIEAYDDLLSRFGVATESVFVELVAEAKSLKRVLQNP